MSTMRGQINLSVLASEEFTAAEAPSAGAVSERTLRTGKGNALDQTLNSTTTPKITKPAISRSIELGGSPTVLNLTAVAAAAIPAAASRSIDLTGAKLVAFSLRADDENADPILVGPGASSDTYDLFGTGIDLPISPGQQIAGSFRIAPDTPAVASGVKNIEISGTSGDILYLDLLFGVQT